MGKGLNKRPRPGARGPTRAPMFTDIAWAAGIYEGEGSCNKKGIRVYQKDPWLLYRLQELFGGAVHLRPSAKGVWDWDVAGVYGRNFVAAIWPWLSPRRQAQLAEKEWEPKRKWWYQANPWRKTKVFNP